jgi:uncharacterized membrane protein
MFGWEILAWSVCARQESHLLFLGERSLAFCARCTAWYGGMGISALLILFFKRSQHSCLPPGKISIWSIFCLLLMGLDAITDLLGWRGATLGTRLFSGFLAGTGIPLLVAPIAASFRKNNITKAVISARESILWWGLALIHALGLLLVRFVVSGLWVEIVVLYFNALAVVGLGFLVYTVSRMALHLLAKKRVVNTSVSAGFLAGLILLLLWILHTAMSQNMGYIMVR